MIFSQLGYIVENLSQSVILIAIFIFTFHAKVSASGSATKAAFTTRNNHLLLYHLLLESSPGYSMKRALHEPVFWSLETKSAIEKQDQK